MTDKITMPIGARLLLTVGDKAVIINATTGQPTTVRHAPAPRQVTMADADRATAAQVKRQRRAAKRRGE